MSEVQMKNQTKPVCSITNPENPARMLPGKAQREVSRPNWLAACSTDAIVDMSPIPAGLRTSFNSTVGPKANFGGPGQPVPFLPKRGH
jgi:hypothetical protein